MLIGQIEQEILEGRFWFYWLQTHCDESSPDLQENEAEAVWRLRQLTPEEPETEQTSESGSR